MIRGGTLALVGATLALTALVAADVRALIGRPTPGFPLFANGVVDKFPLSEIQAGFDNEVAYATERQAMSQNKLGRNGGPNAGVAHSVLDSTSKARMARTLWPGTGRHAVSTA